MAIATHHNIEHSLHETIYTTRRGSSILLQHAISRRPVVMTGLSTGRSIAQQVRHWANHLGMRDRP